MNDDPSLLSIVHGWGMWAITGLIAVAAYLIRWVYMRDGEKIDSALAGIKSDHGELLKIVREIDATRPLRSELAEAVDDLRHEVSVEFASLRGEIRADINGLRNDMTTRLDTLIRMQGGK